MEGIAQNADEKVGGSNPILWGVVVVRHDQSACLIFFFFSVFLFPGSHRICMVLKYKSKVFKYAK